MYYSEITLSLTRIQAPSRSSVLLAWVFDPSSAPEDSGAQTHLCVILYRILFKWWVEIMPTGFFSFPFFICCSLLLYRQYTHPSTIQLQCNCISLYFSLLCLCFERQWCVDKSLGVRQTVNWILALHLLAVWPWTSYLTYLILGYPTCKMRGCYCL